MLAEVVAGVILLSLMVYTLLAGADFGGGTWDLLARGPRAGAQREVVAHAIGPVWEANHVWMIVVVVLLFTAFPTAFAVIMTALHVPVTLMLVGIVLRGSAFVVRKLEADVGETEGADAWRKVFAVSSLVTPVMLGVILGALSTPAIGYEDGVVTGGFVDPWLAPFPWAVGLLTLALFSWLAAVYLVLETRDPALREDFRARALWSGVATGALAAAAAWMARGAAPEVAGHLLESASGRAVGFAGAAAWVAAMGALAARRWVLARSAAGAVAVLLLAGWGLGMHPWLVAGSVGIRDAAAPDVTLRLVLGILAGGTVLLVPAFGYLYWVFKRGVLFPERAE